MGKKKKKYYWQRGEDLPDIDDHSLVKLEIIEEYLAIYLRVLTQNCKMDSLKLTIVDGFSGGGLYKGNVEGSPLRILKTINAEKAAINTRRLINKCREINFDITTHLIELEKPHCEFLKYTLQERDYDLRSGAITLTNSDFSSRLDSLIKSIKAKSRTHRAIFVLDQYGYIDAPITDIRRIFWNLQNAEVILTFSMDSLIDYLSEQSTDLLAKLGLSKIDIERILDERQDTTFSRAKLQPVLFESIVNRAGAHYYTPFFIASDKTNRAYWLFHFSSHTRARNEMMKLHWSKQNTFQHFGGAGLNMLLGYTSGNRNLLYDFSLFSREQSLDLLQEQVPKKIYEKKELTFKDLKNEIINSTPATEEMIKESLTEAIRQKDIIVTSKRKVIRHKGTTIKDDDLIARSHTTQPKLF